MIANPNLPAALNPAALSATRVDEPPTFALLHEGNSQDAVCIRRCRKSDRAGISRLCCDTGFLGQPVDSLFCDRELFADLFTRPYLKYESEWGLVAEANGRVVGYLLGSVNRHFEWLQMWSGLQTTSKMILRLATGRYAKHQRSRKFIRWLFTAGMREQPRHPSPAAHLHFDIEKQYRGRGVGRKMWNIFERRLREAGIQRCYGAFFSYPKRRPESAYARFGFSIYDRCRTTLFEPEIAEPVDVICVCKDL